MQRILLLLTGLFIAFVAMGQSKLEQRMDFSAVNLPVSDVLLSLCEKADLSVSFQSRLFSADQKITFEYKNQTVKSLLDACLKQTEIDYKWENNRVVLYQKPPPIYTISGFLEDSLSGERLVAANVYDYLSGKGTTTNEYGFYSLSIPRGKAALSFSYLGFNPKTYQINIKKNLHFNVPLKASITLAEVVVVDSKYQLKEGLSVTDAPNFASGKLAKMPSIGGEPDIIRYFQTLPGVEAGAGSFGGMHVRGGEADQNLVLLDGVPVYNSSHMLGLFSIFNESIVKNARLYKGKFPAKYGGRLSSVVDIQTKEGNDKEFKFGGAVSLFATSLFAEGPIKKEKTSFFVAGRRTHLDPLFNAFVEEEPGTGDVDRIGYYFYDINAKLNHTFSDKDKVYVSFYRGADNLQSISSFNDDFVIDNDGIEPTLTLSEQSDFVNINWGNTIISTRWNRVWNNKLFSNMTATFSEFGFQLFTVGATEFEKMEGSLFDVDQYIFDSNIQDIALKIDFDYIPNPKHHIKFGGGVLERIFTPTFDFQELEDLEADEFSLTEEYIPSDSAITNYYATELNFYLEDDIKFTDKLSAQLGFHNAVFTSDNAGWISFQPRLSIQYQIHPSGTVYAAYSRMGQFLHVLSPAGVSMPFDLWVPSTKKVRPQVANQFLVGTDWKLPQAFTFSTEAYFKKLDHLITYRAGVNSVLSGTEEIFDWENEVTFGEGWNYGLEASLKRTKGKTNGYINYALSKATRRFDGLSNDERFPFRYNRRHVIKIGLSQEFTPKFNVFATWSYGSGQYTTPRLIEVYGDGTSFDGFDLDLIGSDGPLNTFRLPANHQLDVSFNWHWPRKKVDHFFTFGLKNVYNRTNPLFAIRVKNLDGNGETFENEDFPGLPIFPSLRYSIKF